MLPFKLKESNKTIEDNAETNDSSLGLNSALQYQREVDFGLGMHVIIDSMVLENPNCKIRAYFPKIIGVTSDITHNFDSIVQKIINEEKRDWDCMNDTGSFYDTIYSVYGGSYFLGDYSILFANTFLGIRFNFDAYGAGAPHSQLTFIIDNEINMFSGFSFG